MCECGRPAILLPHIKKKSSRNTRMRNPVALKAHPMCAACWERQSDSWFGNSSSDQEVSDVVRKSRRDKAHEKQKTRDRAPLPNAPDECFQALLLLAGKQRFIVADGNLLVTIPPPLNGFAVVPTWVLDALEDLKWARVNGDEVTRTIHGCRALATWMQSKNGQPGRLLFPKYERTAPQTESPAC